MTDTYDFSEPAATRAENTRQTTGAQYYLNPSKKIDQAVLGPDGASRLVPPGCYVHVSQFGNPNLPEKAAKRGIFVAVKNEEKIRIAGDRDRKLIVGGHLNNARGHYHRKVG